MPNLNNQAHQTQVVREVIPLTDSHKENRYFFLTLIGILLSAALLLWFTGHKDHHTIRLPNHLSNLATQLSIASDELAMLQDIEMVSQQPSLTELLDNELAPFTAEHFVMAGENCFVIDKQEVQLRLIKLYNEPWQVQWRESGAHENHANHADTLDETHNDTRCQAIEEWRAVAHLATDKSRI